jgi:quercetin dioxygenase-like cupin family protein
MTSKSLLLQPGEGRGYDLGAIKAVFKADGGETSAAYSISEWQLAPRALGPGAHSHDEDDIFFVTEGQVSFLIGEHWQQVGKGGFVLAAGGTLHDFRNDTDEPVGFLNISVPGGFEPMMPSIAEWFQERHRAGEGISEVARADVPIG